MYKLWGGGALHDSPKKFRFQCKKNFFRTFLLKCTPPKNQIAPHLEAKNVKTLVFCVKKKNYDLFIKVYHEFYQKKIFLPPALENPGSATGHNPLG